MRNPRQRGPVSARSLLLTGLVLLAGNGLLPGAVTASGSEVHDTQSASDASTAPNTGGATLTLGDARYRGELIESGAVEAFRGIPFAAPPVGDRRWRPPAPAPERSGDRDATAFKPVCVQGTYMSDWYRGVVSGFGGDATRVENPAESEDCLYLNLWRPSERPAEPLPVIVYIHGGGNTGGWSWEPNYLGHQLAREGFVVITITYRLGIFGFFAHPEQEVSNFGLLDQVVALRWLQANAAAIGADPDRVTVVGESAGGNNIIALIASPLAQGLFQRAAVQSAGWALQETPRKADLDTLGLALEAEVVGAGAGLQALRAAPASAVFKAAQAIHGESGYEPAIDGHSLLKPPIKAVNQGRFSTIDLLIGSNRDEWKMYLQADATLDEWTEQGLPPAARTATERLLAEEPDRLRALDRAVTAWNMVCPSLHLAEAVERSGGRSWVYWFTRVRPGELAGQMGAYHGAELPYVFDTHDDWLPTDTTDRALTREIVTYWTRFARTGDPNSAGDGAQTQTPLAWPRFTALEDPVLQLDQPLGTLPHPERALCATLGVEGQKNPEAMTRNQP
ncbi:MAG: carboxylesterase family protein [Pseudomonadota bacterium]